MRKSLIALGAIGSAVGAYVLAKPKLRKELQKAEGPVDVFQTFEKHVGNDMRAVQERVAESQSGMWASMKRYFGGGVLNVAGRTAERDIAKVATKAAVKAKIAEVKEKLEKEPVADAEAK